MTPNEIQFMRDLGHALQRGLAQVTTNSIFYGIHTLMFGITTTTFNRRGLTSWPSRWMLGSNAFAYLLSGAATFSSIAKSAILTREALVQNIALPVDQNRALAAEKLHPVFVVQQWMTTLLPILTLIVFIWRAWVTSPVKRPLVIVPFALWLTSFATTTVYLGFISASATSHIPETAARVYDVSLGLSLLTSLVTTALIGYNLFSNREDGRINPEGKKASWIRCFYFVVESGFFFLPLQIVILVLHVVKLKFPTFAGDVMSQVWTATYFSLAGMYPNVIVVFVLYGQSLVNDPHIKNQEASGLTFAVMRGHPSFAAPDNGTGSLKLGSDPEKRTSLELQI